MTPLLIGLAALSAAGVTFLVSLIGYRFIDREGKLTQRLKEVARERKNEPEITNILKEPVLPENKKGLLVRLTERVPSLQRFMVQADCRIPAGVLVGIGLLQGAIGATGSILAGVSPLLAPLLGATMFSVPFLWVWNKRRVRLKTFAAQLPDALELLGRALSSGNSLNTGLALVGEEMTGPVGDEFRRAYEEQELGISIEDALKHIYERTGNFDFRFFVTAVTVQRQTGGNLVEILDKIQYVIRERYQILGQVKALTAEGRLSGVILLALPFALWLMMLHIKPDYMDALWTSELGRQMVVGALVLQVIGALVIKKIVNIKV